METPVQDVLLKYGHSIPSKPQLLPHNHQEINYGSKTQFSPSNNTIPPLDDSGILRVQCVFGALLYCVRAVKKYILVSISAIVTQQAAANEDTMSDVHMLLEYVDIYPNNSTTYQFINMILTNHSDSGYLNK